MNLGRPMAVALAGLAAILLCRSTWGEENEGGPAGKERPVRPGREGRLGPQQGPGGMRPMMPGMDIPVVREEMQRHTEALRNLMVGQRELAKQVAAEAKALREKQTPQADIDKALADKFGAQAQATATQLADELARHFEAMTKLYMDNREETLKQLTESILRRMANREPGARPGPLEKGERPKAREKAKDNRPENF